MKTRQFGTTFLSEMQVWQNLTNLKQLCKHWKHL